MRGEPIYGQHTGKRIGTRFWLPVLWFQTRYGCRVRDKYGRYVLYCFNLDEI